MSKLQVWKYLLCGALISAPAQAELRKPAVSYSPHRSTVNHPAPSSADAILSTIGMATVIPAVAHATGDYRRQTLCLALGLYHEARGETEAGRLAVGLVILNRIKSTGLSICQVLWKAGQFPWTHKPTDHLTPRELAAWRIVQETALRLRTEKLDDITKGATMFYNEQLVHPNWRGHVTAKFGNHVFVRPISARVSYATLGVLPYRRLEFLQ